MYEPSTARDDDAPTMLVRDAVFELLRNLGITTIFGNPGSTELPFLKNMPADFRYILGLQEVVAMGMADGFAQGTGNAALVNLHSAAGLGHALGNMFTAWKNHTPIIVTAGQQARSLLQLDPFLFAQTPTEFPRPYVKWACEPARAQDVPAALMRAYAIAMQPPRGPVFVSIPIDDWEQTTTPVNARDITQARGAAPDAIARLGERIEAATRPVIVAGDDISRDGAMDALITLAERINAPVWAAPMSGRCNFPETHRLFAGFLPAAREPIVKELTGQDLVLALGAPVFTYHIEGSGPMLPPGADLIQLINNPDIAAWAQVGSSVVTDLRLALEALLARPAPTTPRPVPPPRRAPPPLPGTAGISDKLFFQTLARLRPADAIIVEEAPSARPAMHDYLPIEHADGFFAGASGGLGHGLPAAIGMAMARPDRKVIAVIGDGSAMYAIQALWTASHLKLPLTVIILKNGNYEALMRFGRLFGMQNVPGAHFPDLDFRALATGQSCEALRVEGPDQLEDTLRTALAAKFPTLVEIIID